MLRPPSARDTSEIKSSPEPAERGLKGGERNGRGLFFGAVWEVLDVYHACCPPVPADTCANKAF